MTAQARCCVGYVHADGSNTPLVWFEGSGVTAPQYLYADHQGSITARTNASGAVTNVTPMTNTGSPARAPVSLVALHQQGRRGSSVNPMRRQLGPSTQLRRQWVNLD
jgi:hypothetical protein